MLTVCTRLGETLGYKPGGKLKYMALGQSMGPKAVELVETGAQRGLWVMLQVGACARGRQYAGHPQTVSRLCHVRACMAQYSM